MLFVIQGPSGSGKTTQAEFLAERPDFFRLITATTRPPRPGEIDGADYYFLSAEAFSKKKCAGALLATTEIHGACYGIPKTDLDALVQDKNRHAVVVLDDTGAKEVQAMGAKRICFVIEEKARTQRLLARKENGRFLPERIDNRRCDLIVDASGREDAIRQTIESYIEGVLTRI